MEYSWLQMLARSRHWRVHSLLNQITQGVNSTLRLLDPNGQFWGLVFLDRVCLEISFSMY